MIINIVIKKGMIVMSENINRLAVIENESEYNTDYEDNEGSKSLIWIIVLFLVFRHIFSSVFLALLIAYILAPRKEKDDENISQEE